MIDSKNHDKSGRLRSAPVQRRRIPILSPSLSVWNWLAVIMLMLTIMSSNTNFIMPVAAQGQVGTQVVPDPETATQRPAPTLSPPITRPSVAPPPPRTTVADDKPSASSPITNAPQSSSSSSPSASKSSTVSPTNDPNENKDKPKMSEEAVIIIVSVLGAAAFAALVMTVAFKRYKARDTARRQNESDDTGYHGGWKPQNPFATANMAPSKPDLSYLNY